MQFASMKWMWHQLISFIPHCTLLHHGWQMVLWLDECGRWYEEFWSPGVIETACGPFILTHLVPLRHVRQQQQLRANSRVSTLRADGICVDAVCVCVCLYLSVCWMSPSVFFFRPSLGYLPYVVPFTCTRTLWCHKQHYLTGSWEAIHHLIKSVWKGSVT